MIIAKMQKILSSSVWGVTSPYPTVVIVVKAQYNATKYCRPQYQSLGSMSSRGPGEYDSYQPSPVAAMEHAKRCAQKNASTSRNKTRVAAAQCDVRNRSSIASASALFGSVSFTNFAMRTIFTIFNTRSTLMIEVELSSPAPLAAR